MGSYIPFPFTCTVSGNQLVFTFTGIPASTTSMTLPNPYYVNIPNLTIKIDRLNQNLVHFGDNNGIITVNFTLSTSPSPAGGLAAWLLLVIGLLPIPLPPIPGSATDQILGWNGTNFTLLGPAASRTASVTSVSKGNAQNIVSGGDQAVLFNVININGTDVSYNAGTGLFTVNVTGSYSYIGNMGLSTNVTTGNGVFYYMSRSGVTVNSAFIFSVSYATFGGRINFTAGDTFTIRLQNGSLANISPRTDTPICSGFSIQRIPTSTV